MPHLDRIIVAFRTAPAPAYAAETDEAVRALYASQPYTATLAEAYFIDPRNGSSTRWRDTPGPGDAPRPPVSLRAAAWLARKYPDAWPHALAALDRRHLPAPAPGRAPGAAPPPDEKRAAVLIGFDIRLFLDIVAAECSFPANQPGVPLGEAAAPAAYLPLSLWRDPAACVEMLDLVKPDRYPALTWKQVLAARLPVPPPDLAAWERPHADAEKDAALLLLLAGQLGLLNQERVTG